MAMNRFSCVILVQLAGLWSAVAQTDTSPGDGRQVPVPAANMNQASVAGHDGTSPAITISARNLDFGAVLVDSNNELSFVIQNTGDSTLTGTAQVSPPFRIIGGNTFVLKPAQTQLVTVQYAPTSTGMHMTVVRLTGASVTVMGSAAPRRAPARRHRGPAQPEGLRLLARRQGHSPVVGASLPV